MVPKQGWTIKSMAPCVIKAEYAVRGPLAIRAEELDKSTLPLKKIVGCNIGNPQQLGQKPITFLRQLAALVEYPEMSNLFPKDVVKRANEIIMEIGSVGAYSQSQGIQSIRQMVAEFISLRDNIPSNKNNIFLTSGASEGVRFVLQCLVTQNTGILVPVPQYPLYTATIALLQGESIGYYLDEQNEWSINCNEIRKTIMGRNVKAIVVINPGNPTGSVLKIKIMQEILKLCFDEDLVLIADEVYQENVYKGEFISFRKVLSTMDLKVQMVSLHSCSKGVLGECGRRGGYFELHNIDEEVKKQLYKLASISLCPNVQGQIAVSVLCNPPKPGDESYKLYIEETTQIKQSLQRRSEKLCDFFNGLKNVSCTRAAGAMYLFPKIEIPSRAQREAKKMNLEADEHYCFLLLEKTGICMVPGSGFLQFPNTFHVRTTFLPNEDTIQEVIMLIEKFHMDYMDLYE